jgi:hypothetical protein
MEVIPLLDSEMMVFIRVASMSFYKKVTESSFLPLGILSRPLIDWFFLAI